jgi:hypothetical protein
MIWERFDEWDQQIMVLKQFKSLKSLCIKIIFDRTLFKKENKSSVVAIN